eukprot:1156492-Pelagomonas_calceolata.AAC.7
MAQWAHCLAEPHLSLSEWHQAELHLGRPAEQHLGQMEWNAAPRAKSRPDRVIPSRAASGPEWSAPSRAAPRHR